MICPSHHNEPIKGEAMLVQAERLLHYFCRKPTYALATAMMAVWLALPASASAQAMSSTCSPSASAPIGISCVTTGATTCSASGSDMVCSYPGYWPASSSTCNLHPVYGLQCSAGVAGNGTSNCQDSTGFRDWYCVPSVTALQVVYQSNFPSVPFTSTPPLNYSDKTISVTNTGTNPTQITSIQTTSSEFALLSNPCTGWLSPGQSCSLVFRFTPTTAGYKAGLINISAANSPWTAQTNVTGTGYAGPGTLVLASAAPNFGTNAYGTVAPPQVITVQNTGASPVSLTSTTVSAIDYSITNTSCPTEIPPGGSCNLNVEFMPYAAGNRSSTIVFKHNGEGGATGVTVTGSGAGAPGLVFGSTNVVDINIAGPTGGVVGVTTDAPAPQSIGSIPLVCPRTGSTPNCPPWSDPFRPFEFGGGAGGGARWPLLTDSRQEGPDDPCLAQSAGGGSEGGSAGESAGPQEIGANVPPTDPVYTADPIHAALGNKAHEQIDYRSTAAFNVEFSRVYHAQAPLASGYIKQSLGPGWYSVLDRSINVLPDGNSLRATRGSGVSIEFTKLANGTWAAPQGVSDTLIRLVNQSGGFEGWTYRSGLTTERFNNFGRLVTVALDSGGVYTLAYTQSGNGQLQAVADPSGRLITFLYDSQNRVVSMTNPAGGITEYRYDEGLAKPLGLLTSVKYPDNRVRQYKYEDPKYKFALTSIINEGGARYVTFQYDPATGRAIGNKFGLNQDKGVAAVNFANVTTTGSVAQDASGATVTRKFQYLPGSGLVKPTSIQYANVCAGCSVPEETFTYDTAGRVLTAIDRRNVKTTYAYTTDGRGLLASKTEAAETGLMRTTTTTWHPTLPLPMQVVEPTKMTNYTYDSAGRNLTTGVTASGQTRTTTNTYDAAGRLVTVDGPRTDVNDITSYTYHPNGTVHTVTNPKGQVTTYNYYDAHGNPTSITNSDGTTSIFSYDVRGRLLVKSHAGLVTTNTYDANGLLKTITDPYGGVTTNLYDDAHRLIGKDLSNGEKLRYTLDNAGRTIVTETFDAQNNLSAKSSVVYDGLGRVLQRVSANGKITSYTYDANGNMTSVTDPNGLTTSTQFDALNRPILVTDALMKSVETAYTPHDKVASVKDPNNNYTYYTYNGFGDNTGVQSPDTGNTTITFNPAGLPVVKTDARGKTTTHVYDELNRLMYLIYNDGQGVYKAFDIGENGVGKLVQVSDPSGSTTYAYDAYGRVTGKSTNVGGVNKSVYYGRDNKGRITAITYPSGNVVGMSYSQGRVTNITLNGAPLISAIQYFPFGGPESWLLGADAGGTKDYTRWIDENQRIEKYSTPLGYRGLTFDDGGRITSIKNYQGLQNPVLLGTQTFGYDNAGRLTSFSGFTSNGNAQLEINQTQSFTYDSNGNRTSDTLNGVVNTYGYQAGTNRLVGVSGAITKSNTFDLAGNLIADGSATFNYDARGRMFRATVSGVATNYLVNFQSLRVRKNSVNEVKYFLYDDDGHMLGEYDPNGSTVQELIWLNDVPVALVGTMPCLSGGGCTEPGIAYIWTDHLNTPRELTRVNASNQHVLLWKWDSLPFGATQANANPSILGAMNFNHRFPGQYRDSETGLHQNWHRDYDAVQGRYVTSDPIGLNGGTNTFTYAFANPIGLTDRTGLCPVCLAVFRAWSIVRGAINFCRGAGKPSESPVALTQVFKEKPAGPPLKSEEQIAKELNDRIKDIGAQNLDALERNRQWLNSIAEALKDQGYSFDQIKAIMGRLMGGGTGFGG